MAANSSGLIFYEIEAHFLLQIDFSAYPSRDHSRPKRQKLMSCQGYFYASACIRSTDRVFVKRPTLSDEFV
jgi:hypothetical protein